MDLEHQLKLNCEQIQNRYASFVYSLSEYVIKKGVGASKLRRFILNLPASQSSRNRDKLKKADDIDEIFDLTEDCASFVHYDIYQSIRDTFCSGWKDFPELNYPKDFRDYIERHTIEEFSKSIPNLKEKHAKMASKELTFKFDNIHVHDRVIKLEDLRMVVAKVLRLHPSEVLLIDVEKGCVIVTFLIPTSVAEDIFAQKLSSSQVKEFEMLSVLWIRCGNFEMKFTTGVPSDVNQEENPQISDSGDSMCVHGKMPGIL